MIIDSLLNNAVTFLIQEICIGSAEAGDLFTFGVAVPVAAMTLGIVLGAIYGVLAGAIRT